MKAIIMAGGEGSRLRPLTCDCPKPMLPLMGKPLMEYAVRLLQAHGITEIAVTLGYLPDPIMDYFGDGRDFGVNLHYYIEKTPLGTAGSIRQAEDFLTERFIVLSGDGVTDFNLQEALDFHHKNDSLATLLLKKCAHPQEYGMVVTDPAGRILSFHEKPGRCDVFSDRINTGIYILEPEILRRIPENAACDFGHELFPALLKEDAALYGFTASGYWCDVGDVPAYLKVHRDALDGKIRIDLPADMRGISARGAVLESGCRIESPCFIGEGSFVSAGAHIGPYTVIGKNCRVDPSASIKRSVLFDHVHAQSGCQLRGCIAGTGAHICENAQMYEDSAIGSRSGIGMRAVLPPGVKLWPDKVLPDGERPQNNIVWGSCRRHRFVGGGFELESPVFAARAAQACAAEMKPREILLGRNSSAAAGAAWHAAAAGILAQGVRVIDCGECTLPQLRCTQRSICADAAMLATPDALFPLNARGAFPIEKNQRAILRLCERQDYSPAHSIARPMESAGRTDIAYIAHAASAFRAEPADAPPLAVFSQSAHHLRLAEQAFERAGLQVRCEWDVRGMLLRPGELAVFLSDDGQQTAFADADGRLDDAAMQLLIAWAALESGQPRLILHNSATRAADVLAEKYGASALYLPGEYALWMNRLAEKSRFLFDLQFDGIYSALACLSALAKKELSLRQWLRQMPPVYRKTASVSVPESDCARLLHIIAGEAAHTELGGGVRIVEKDHWAWLSPDERGAGLQITAEAPAMEIAADMCDSLAQKLRRLMQD